MTVKEYLEKMQGDPMVTFIIAEAHHEVASFWGYRYRTTPLQMKRDWLESTEWCESFLVINADHPPIDVTGSWINGYKRGFYKCAMIVKPEEMRKTYRSEQQYNEMVDFYNRNVK